MSQKLSGQVAIVTGASSGVGWQSAVRRAEQAIRPCVTARRESTLDALRENVLSMLSVGGAPMSAAGASALSVGLYQAARAAR